LALKRVKSEQKQVMQNAAFLEWGSEAYSPHNSHLSQLLFTIIKHPTNRADILSALTFITWQQGIKTPIL
jgi:hypothetical protein